MVSERYISVAVTRNAKLWQKGDCSCRGEWRDEGLKAHLLVCEENVLAGNRFVSLVPGAEFIHRVIRHRRSKFGDSTLVYFTFGKRGTWQEIARLLGILSREIAVQRVRFIHVPSGKGIFFVNHIINITDALMVL